MQASTIARNQWHDRAGTNPVRLGTIYGSPNGWFMKSLQAPPNMEMHDAYVGYSIRVAAIFKRGSNIKSLVANSPWSLLINWPLKNWTIILASPQDAVEWIDQAYKLGAEAWYIDDLAQVFEYQAIDWKSREDDFINDVKIENRGGARSDSPYAKGVDHAAVREDLKQGYLSAIEIGKKHNISRTMVYNIRSNMLKGVTKRSKDFDEQAVMKDITSKQYSRQEVIERHKMTISQLQVFQKKHKLIGFFKRGAPNSK